MELMPTASPGLVKREFPFAAIADFSPQPTARVFAIIAADDEPNRPETGVMEQAMRRVKHGLHMLIPGSVQTAGHGDAANRLDAMGGYETATPDGPTA
jgi:hypothetical protein